MRGRRLLQTIFDRLRGQRLRKILLGRGCLLANQRNLDRRRNFSQRHGMSRLPLLHLDNVVAIRALHNLRIADLLRENRILKGRNHHAAPCKAQFAALVLAARVVRVLRRQFGKVRAALNLLEQPLGLGLGRCVGLGVGACRHLDQNVPRTRLLRNRVLALVLLEVLLNLLLADLRNAARQIAGANAEVGHLALLRNRRRVPRGILLEEGLQLGVRGLDRILQRVGGNHRVVKLDLDVLLEIGGAHLGVAHLGAGGDQRPQAADNDLLLHLLLESGNRHIELPRNEISVAVLADKFAVGEEKFAELPLMQKVRHICVVGIRCPASPPQSAEPAPAPVAGRPAAPSNARSSGFRAYCGLLCNCRLTRWLTACWLIVTPEEKIRLYQ